MIYVLVLLKTLPLYMIHRFFFYSNAILKVDFLFGPTVTLNQQLLGSKWLQMPHTKPHFTVQEGQSVYHLKESGLIVNKV